jgi:hypothetical protein
MKIFLVASAVVLIMSAQFAFSIAFAPLLCALGV